VMSFNGKLSMVKCKVCSFAEKKTSFLFSGLMVYISMRKRLLLRNSV
jgi:hypothetical protein